jgi:hypothetical protein
MRELMDALNGINGRRLPATCADVRDHLFKRPGFLAEPRGAVKVTSANK